MTDSEKRRILNHYMFPVYCIGCGKEIPKGKDKSLEDVEFVRTKRKTDIFFHRECMGRVWNPEL